MPVVPLEGQRHALEGYRGARSFVICSRCRLLPASGCYPGDGEECDACEEPIPKNQLLMEGISLDGDRRPVQFHVACFYLWDEVRKAPGR
jgi:hypothetical protein